MTSVSMPPTPAYPAGQISLFNSRGAYGKALDDIADGFARRWLWGALALQDIRLRYRGSMLGPFWLTLSTAIMIGAMGTLYPKLFHMDAGSYVPFLATGLVIWQFISGILADGCNTFVEVQHIIQQAKMPYTVHAFRVVYRNILILGHNAVIIPGVYLVLGHPLTWQALEIIPALTILAINGVWICLLLGMVSARFRDIPPIVGSVVQVLFFVTPVFWTSETLGEWRSLAELNPLFAAIDVVRSPLLGTSVAPHSWAILMGITVGGVLLSFRLFSRFRPRIAYWV